MIVFFLRLEEKISPGFWHGEPDVFPEFCVFYFTPILSSDIGLSQYRLENKGRHGTHKRRWLVLAMKALVAISDVKQGAVPESLL